MLIGRKLPQNWQSVWAHGDALYRLLRALACVGIFAEDEEGRFSLTPLADQLRTDIPDSQRAIAIMMGAEFHQSWGNLLHSVRTGREAWYKTFGRSCFATILDGDLIYVDKVAYDLRVPLTLHRLARWSEPERGDIVVCLSPEDGVRLVKRVVGRPGDAVEMRRNVLLLNGRPLEYSETDRSYAEEIPQEHAAGSRFALEELGEAAHPVMIVPNIPAMRNFGPIVVPEGQYLVLGDNRDLSRDSRYFGLVPRASILGRARGVILSFDITDKYQPRIDRFFTGLQ